MWCDVDIGVEKVNAGGRVFMGEFNGGVYAVDACNENKSTTIKKRKRVTLPSGVIVRAERSYWGLSLNVFSPKDTNIKGLCGNFDKKEDNDFDKENGFRASDANEFGESWRMCVVFVALGCVVVCVALGFVLHVVALGCVMICVACFALGCVIVSNLDKNNFFEKLPSKAGTPYEEKSCKCKRNKDDDDDCNKTSNHFNEYVERLNSIKRTATCHHGRVYSDDIMKREVKSYFVDEKDMEYAHSRIRHRRGIERASISPKNATRICKSIIEDSVAGKVCGQLSGIELPEITKNCIFDLQRMSAGPGVPEEKTVHDRTRLSMEKIVATLYKK
ncbi:predicted protein [Nematostella vectensis]|uniref:VWFD domain-containing protein n=1 Tax=Nematostella vectensis TaxID=45351 RepID=A7T033_NEMVE|nr:predicted protein [Nematostella vectensis]|eukprot:XP_001622783.1 predicted protein [Nematostella vectensis]